MAAAKADVDTALLMGAPLLRCFTSCSGDYTEDIQKREVECFQEICDFAAAKGVTVGCQNHPSTGEHMMRIFNAVNRPNFTFVMDTGQWVGGANGNRGPADEEVPQAAFAPLHHVSSRVVVRPGLRLHGAVRAPRRARAGEVLPRR